MLIDLAVNLCMLGVDVAALSLVRRKREPKWLAVAIAGFAFAVFMGMVLSLAKVGLFGAMRALAWVIFIHAVILLSGCAVLFWRPHRKVALASAMLAGVIAGVGIDAFFIEPHWLEITRVQISSPKLKRPLRIAIVADIQTDEIGDYERDALRRVAAENPDLVLYAGDYVQIYDDERRRAVMGELRQAIRDAGIRGKSIAVEGNCDHQDWPSIFEGTDVECTRETRAFLHENVQITTLSLMDSEYGDTPVPPSNRFSIVVGHRPDFALNNAIQADLLVAGHTHGGQVRLPFIGPLITLSRVPRSWAAGVTELPGRTLIVARGIGMERGPAPRLRFLCRPELVIVDLVPAAKP